MNLIIYILSIYGLAFLIKETDGPWGIMSWIRNSLVTNKYVGVFFYKLLSCYFCIGCHAGWIIYLLSAKHYHFNLLICWMLAGGVISLILDGLLTWLATPHS